MCTWLFNVMYQGGFGFSIDAAAAAHLECCFRRSLSWQHVHTSKCRLFILRYFVFAKRSVRAVVNEGEWFSVFRIVF